MRTQGGEQSGRIALWKVFSWRAVAVVVVFDERLGGGGMVAGLALELTAIWWSKLMPGDLMVMRCSLLPYWISQGSRAASSDWLRFALSRGEVIPYGTESRVAFLTSQSFANDVACAVAGKECYVHTFSPTEWGYCFSTSNYGYRQPWLTSTDPVSCMWSGVGSNVHKQVNHCDSAILGPKPP